LFGEHFARSATNEIDTQCVHVESDRIEPTFELLEFSLADYKAARNHTRKLSRDVLTLGMHPCRREVLVAARSWNSLGLGRCLVCVPIKIVRQVHDT
jgi:hypothetical protein